MSGNLNVVRCIIPSKDSFVVKDQGNVVTVVVWVIVNVEKEVMAIYRSDLSILEKQNSLYV